MAGPEVRVQARVVTECRRGRSRCTTLRSAPPISFRVTPDGLHLVGTAAGPLGGDDLVLDVTVGSGASLRVRSAAAQLVLPGPALAPSTMQVAVAVGPGAALSWMPEPTVLVEGADHRLTTVIDLAAEADLAWRDEVVLGRDGEAGGSLLHRSRVERDGHPLLCNEVALGPAWPSSTGPAGTGGARVVASTILVGTPARVGLDRFGAFVGLKTRTGVFRLADDAVLVSVLGDELDEVRSASAFCRE